MKSIFATMAAAAAIATGCAGGKGTTPVIAGKWYISSAYGTSTANGMETAYISFGEGGEMNGNASINNFFGSYSQDGNELILTNIGLTQMMGPNIEIEDAVVRAINNLKTISVSGDTALVMDGKGETIMTLVRENGVTETEPMSLSGRWNITEAYGSSTDNAADTAYIEFNEQGVSGNTGANNFMGNYTNEDTSLTFADISTTKMGAGPYRETEQSVLNALNAAQSVKISGDTAIVADGDGNVVMKLAAVK